MLRARTGELWPSTGNGEERTKRGAWSDIAGALFSGLLRTGHRWES